MTPFQEQIAADNAAVFMNENEFAEEHNLNGTVCPAILQDISVAEDLSTGGGVTQTYPGLYGSRLQVNCKKDDLPEVPRYGQKFRVDGKLYLVESCADDVGILTVQLIANDR